MGHIVLKEKMLDAKSEKNTKEEKKYKAAMATEWKIIGVIKGKITAFVKNIKALKKKELVAIQKFKAAESVLVKLKLDISKTDVARAKKALVDAENSGELDDDVLKKLRKTISAA